MTTNGAGGGDGGSGDTATAVSRRRMAAGLGFALAGTTALGGEVARAAQGTPTGGEAPPDFRVVLHVSDQSHWPYALSNLENLRHDWPDASLRVVVDGSGVYSLLGVSEITRRLDALAAGVELQVCPNALREHAIAVDSIPSYANTALGGVVALVTAHRDGFVYVKP